jgi:mono/diheme cytochrome c family protein
VKATAALIAGLVFLFAACATPSVESVSSPVDSSTTDLDGARVDLGRVLYNQQCAVCHGVDLSGDPDWRVPNADGSLRPPPQDSSGHTWHHSDQLLVQIISEGSDFDKSTMPPFGLVLTEDEIRSILDFLKSTWGPDERRFQSEQSVGE